MTDLEENCTFCKDSFREEAFYESEYFFGVFDSYPVLPGHGLVIPKRHVVSYRDLRADEWAQLHNSLMRVQDLIESPDLSIVYSEIIRANLNKNSVKFCKEALELWHLNDLPDGHNIGINEGRAAGRTIDHLHWHIISRYEGDVPDPVGGIRHIIPGKGNYRK